MPVLSTVAAAIAPRLAPPPPFTPAPAALPVRIVCSRAGDRARYDAWDAIRRRVFADELGWPLPPRPPGLAALSDRYDRHATFLTADLDGAPVGIVRALRAIDGFPHRDLLEHHVSAARLAHVVRVVGTVNALAVLGDRRRTPFREADSGATGTAAALLLRAAVRHLAGSGVRVVLATVLSAISGRVFLAEGFRLLDRPFPSPGDPGFLLANVGLALPNDLPADEPANRATRRAAAYFERCHRETLAGGSVDALFRSARG